MPLLLPALFLASCKKDLQTESALSWRKNGGQGLPTMPTVQHGMLVFDNEAKFLDYLDYLDKVVASYPANETEPIVASDSVEIDDKLYEIEQNLGFSSLRQALKLRWDSLDNIGFASLEDIPQLHFIVSSAFRSVLNPYNEVQIGDKIFVFLNDSVTVEILDANLQARNNLREAIIAQGHNGIPPHLAEHPAYLFYDNNSSLKPLPNPLVEDTSAYKSLRGPIRLVVLGEEPISCQPGIRLQLELRQKTANPVLPNDSIEGALNSRVRYEISWGDGTHFTDETRGANNIFTKTYASSGVYQIQVVVKDLRTPGHPVIASLAYTAQISVWPCTNRRETYREWSCFFDGCVKATRRTLSKTNHWGLSRRFHSRGTAKTESFYWTGSVWRSYRADRLGVQMFPGVRDERCLLLAPRPILVAWPTRTRSAEVSVNLRSQGSNPSQVYQSFEFGDFYSHHSISEGRSSASRTVTLRACNP